MLYLLALKETGGYILASFDICSSYPDIHAIPSWRLICVPGWWCRRRVYFISIEHAGKN